MQRSTVLGLVVIAAAGIASIVYVESTGGFALPESDPFPIMSSDMPQFGAPLEGPLAKVSMSRLPNIGETAIVEITYTHDLPFNIIDADPYRGGGYGGFITGWWISPGFEIVDSGGVEYETIYHHGTNQTNYYEYVVFTPLDVGESKTHRIQVKAVSEGYAYVAGLGYFTTEAYIKMHLDDKETTLYSEHRERYPELHVRSERITDEKSLASGTVVKIVPITPEDMKDQEQNTRFMNFTHEAFAALAIEFIRAEDPSTEWILGNILPPRGVFNMTYGEQVLIDAGYTSDEIDSIVSESMSAQSSEQRAASPISPGSVGVTGQITNEEIPFGQSNATEVNNVQLCVFDENLRTGAMIAILCSTVSATGGYLFGMPIHDPDDSTTADRLWYI